MHNGTFASGFKAWLRGWLKAKRKRKETATADEVETKIGLCVDALFSYDLIDLY